MLRRWSRISRRSSAAAAPRRRGARPRPMRCCRTEPPGVEELPHRVRTPARPEQERVEGVLVGRDHHRRGPAILVVDADRQLREHRHRRVVRAAADRMVPGRAAVEGPGAEVARRHGRRRCRWASRWRCCARSSSPAARSATRRCSRRTPGPETLSLRHRRERSVRDRAGRADGYGARRRDLLIRRRLRRRDEGPIGSADVGDRQMRARAGEELEDAGASSAVTRPWPVTSAASCW